MTVTADHHDIWATCWSCPDGTLVAPVTTSAPQLVNGVGWDTTAVVACPECGREYLLTVTMRPLTDPRFRPGNKSSPLYTKVR